MSEQECNTFRKYNTNINIHIHQHTPFFDGHQGQLLRMANPLVFSLYIGACKCASPG